MLPPVPDPETSDAPPAVDVITADDIADLNRMAIERAGAFARVAGSVLVVVAAVGVVAWTWLTVRAQLMADDFSGGSGAFDDVGGSMSFADRVDLLLGYVTILVMATLTGGVGFGLRLGADTAVARPRVTLVGCSRPAAPPPRNPRWRPSAPPGAAAPPSPTTGSRRARRRRGRRRVARPVRGSPAPPAPCRSAGS